jgi:pimeloyl-ACP methyl ester carboxylesterase
LLAQYWYRVVGSGSATPVILLHGELDSLRSRLGYDRVHIVGHSWGTILGFE